MEMQQALQSLMNVEENRVCADCQNEQLRVTHVSVNNSAFICSPCAELHAQDLTPLISLVRPLNSDFWSHEQISTLRAGGGNREFSMFMSKYELATPKVELNRKYNSVSCQYWRDKLHQIQNGLIPQTEMPTKMQGVVQMDRDVEGDWCLVDKSSVMV